MVRVLPAGASPSGDALPAGFRSQQMNWSNRLLSSPRRAPLPLRSVSFSETTTVFLKLRESLETRSSESWKRTVSLLRSLRTYTTWSRRPWTLGSTWRETERIRMGNSASFSSRAESTDLLATTDLPSSSLLLGSTSPRKLTLLCRENLALLLPRDCLAMIPQLLSNQLCLLVISCLKQSFLLSIL